MSPKQSVILTESTKGPPRLHQPGQAAFKAILPEEIEWKPFCSIPSFGVSCVKTTLRTPDVSGSERGTHVHDPSAPDNYFNA
jgi:hypothetical protein